MRMYTWLVIDRTTIGTVYGGPHRGHEIDRFFETTGGTLLTGIRPAHLLRVRQPAMLRVQNDTAED